MKLRSHRYGKARVRVLKILRSEARHDIIEINVTALLCGDFESSYTGGDNTKVVPTDTIKNTIHALAKQDLGADLEPFALLLAQHFLTRYEQVQQAEIEITERNWNRMKIDGNPHPHSFAAGDDSRRFTRVVSTRDGDSGTVESGIRDLILLKSTASGFENYSKCEYTTLPETADRILATSFSASWIFKPAPTNFRTSNELILREMLKVFANNYSPSAQTTLFQMGEAALAICPEITRIDLAMPNKHYLPINLAPFGLENHNDVFVPTDEPHGQIEASLVRDD